MSKKTKDSSFIFPEYVCFLVVLNLKILTLAYKEY